MSEKEFVEQWKFQMVGMALCGAVDETLSTPRDRFKNAYEIPDKVCKLLASMHASMKPAAPSLEAAVAEVCKRLGEAMPAERDKHAEAFRKVFKKG